MNYLNDFADAIRASGLPVPSEIIADGQLHRFSTSDRGRDDAGWYVLFGDAFGERPAGAFGCWRRGLNQRWFAAGNLSPPAHLNQIKRFRQIDAQRLADKQNRNEAALRRAQDLWGRAQPAEETYPYLVSKQIPPFCARQLWGKLLLPVVDTAGQLSSLQFIGPSGEKRFLKDGRKQGCFIPVHTPRNPLQIVICEGFATGCTIAQAEPENRVVAALDAGNLKPVALAIQAAFPRVDICIYGDDDRSTEGNVGRRKAIEAARSLRDGIVCFPDFPKDAPLHLSDFNDLAIWEGGAYEKD
jgi:putative DNA primase/helicase